MDHRGPEFGKLGKQLLEKLRGVFKTSQPVIVFPASGTGAWEAALANTLSPGDRVLMCETGWFAHLWQRHGRRLGLEPELIETDWRRGADVAAIEAALRADKAHAIKAVCVVHNETSHRRAPPASPRCATRSTPPAIRRCCWSTPSPRSARSTTATTNGASTSPSPARRRG